MAKSSLPTSKKLDMSLDDIGKTMRTITGKGYAGEEDLRGPQRKRDALRTRENFGDYDSRHKWNRNSRRKRFQSRNDGRREPKFIVRASNLDHSIMQEDLMELFSSVGEVIKAWVDYDHIDRSKGTGGCIYRFADDAKKAIAKYNGRKIEGKAIELRGEIVMQNRQPFRRQGNLNRYHRNYDRNAGMGHNAKGFESRSPW